MLNYLNTRKANYNAGKINFKTENDTASCINASNGLDISDNIIIDANRKAKCFTAGGNSGGLYSQMELIVHNTMPRSSKTGKGGTGPLSRSDGKTYCLDTGNTNAIEVVGAIKFGRTEEAKSIRKENIAKGFDSTPFQAKEITGIDFEKMATLTTSSSKDNLVLSGTLRTHKDGQGFREVVSGKGATVPARAREDGSGQNVVFINNTIRRLTPRETGRLQSIPEDKLDILLNCGISDTQIYKMFGNGWNIKVIVHILSYFYETR